MEVEPDQLRASESPPPADEEDRPVPESLGCAGQCVERSREVVEKKRPRLSLGVGVLALDPGEGGAHLGVVGR